MMSEYADYLCSIGCPSDLAEQIDGAGITNIWFGSVGVVIDWSQVRCDVAKILADRKEQTR